MEKAPETKLEYESLCRFIRVEQQEPRLEFSVSRDATRCYGWSGTTIFSCFFITSFCKPAAVFKAWCQFVRAKLTHTAFHMQFITKRKYSTRIQPQSSCLSNSQIDLALAGPLLYDIARCGGAVAVHFKP